ncbi:Cyclin-dependent kinase F-4 [Spatholobus suberectus]|nr:Cyclin-dependent kinase F-4 [Spatholobus suberectus]
MPLSVGIGNLSDDYLNQFLELLVGLGLNLKDRELYFETWREFVCGQIATNIGFLHFKKCLIGDFSSLEIFFGFPLLIALSVLLPFNDQHRLLFSPLFTVKFFNTFPCKYRYKLIKEVGDGTFGSVWRAINKQTGEVSCFYIPPSLRSRAVARTPPPAGTRGALDQQGAGVNWISESGNFILGPAQQIPTGRTFTRRVAG